MQAVFAATPYPPSENASRTWFTFRVRGGRKQRQRM